MWYSLFGSCKFREGWLKKSEEISKCFWANVEVWNGSWKLAKCVTFREASNNYIYSWSMDKVLIIKGLLGNIREISMVPKIAKIKQNQWGKIFQNISAENRKKSIDFTTWKSGNSLNIEKNAKNKITMIYNQVIHWEIHSHFTRETKG